MRTVLIAIGSLLAAVLLGIGLERLLGLPRILTIGVVTVLTILMIERLDRRFGTGKKYSK